MGRSQGDNRWGAVVVVGLMAPAIPMASLAAMERNGMQLTALVVVVTCAVFLQPTAVQGVITEPGVEAVGGVVKEPVAARALPAVRELSL